MTTTRLPAITQEKSITDELIKYLEQFFLDEIYKPLIKELKIDANTIVKNSTDNDLIRAIRKGTISFRQGLFKGKFDSRTSQALMRMGATFDKKTSGFRILFKDIPKEIQSEIMTSEKRMEATLDKIDKKLKKLSDKTISATIKVQDIFSKQIFKTERTLSKNISKITVYRPLSKEAQKTIAKEYSDNMDLYIKGWMESEIKELRSKMSDHTNKGVRYEDIIKTIKESYGVSKNKAKFLARQETNLLVTSLQKERYLSAGLTKYEWRCVRGSPNHPVRPYHKALDGTIQEWAKPPIINEKGDRAHAGIDFNCRCNAVPYIEKKVK